MSNDSGLPLITVVGASSKLSNERECVPQRKVVVTK